MGRLRNLAIGGGAALLLSGLGAVAPLPARAANVSCAQTIVQSTVLDGNVGPCDVGITIGADNVTFDLNNFTITGSGGPFGAGPGGDVPGILVAGHSGVTIKNGTVAHFGAGVSLEDGAHNNTVSGMILQDNISASGDYGDGVALVGVGTTANTVIGNVARRNGPYDGIGMIQGASGNSIIGNVVQNNNFTIQDSGIRIEGPGSKNNTISGNSVSGSALDGIEGFGFTNLNSGSVITGNFVSNNGRHGIVLFRDPRAAGAANSVVQDNVIRDNGGTGLLVQSLNNQLLTNKASGSVFNDLQDNNAACDNNAWHGNTGAKATPACVLNP